MFNRKREMQQAKSPFSTKRVAPAIEPLESRRLLSGSFHLGGSGFGLGHHGHNANTIAFSQAPAAVQTGLDNLAATDKVTAPTATQTVFLGNSQGVETYTVDITSTGTETRLTVDQNGNPVTAPTNSTTTFGAITNAAVTKEISAIATALSLTAPTSSTMVKVSTVNGVSTYTVRLSSSSNTTSRHHGGAAISVDSNGNPVGDQNLPFSVIPTAIQNGLNTNRPSGAAALAATSTQTVNVDTANGVTTYSTTFTTNGTQTTVTVNASGQLTKLPSTSTTQFQNIPLVAQKELQTLATADGVSGTISATQTVNVYDEGNGTTIYSVTLSASKTTSGGQTLTFNVTISVDQNGNPTVPPTEGGEFGNQAGEFEGGSSGEFGSFGRRGRRF